MHQITVRIKAGVSDGSTSTKYQVDIDSRYYFKGIYQQWLKSQLKPIQSLLGMRWGLHASSCSGLASYLWLPWLLMVRLKGF